jgi:hypothetical protein
MADGSSGNLPIACGLPGPGFAARRKEIRKILCRRLRTEELADGYAFEFDGVPEMAGRLVDFITAERSCCPFFLFELAFQPDEGSIWLRVRGPEGAKEFVREGFLINPG